ncbi:ABC1 kinase family protein [Actinomadura mexicana]|uniref:Ubiquinone biosynthesis protein n=1 Tax=Actinomadura mexicana TaxID=134959 RepID=A0A238XCY5_9ACTN|nr:AarF/UbiB family protein [Actinomadura mexicana]SNR56502.1 ubiquinone biosynthesis protein [Actinomadura mexicana]
MPAGRASRTIKIASRSAAHEATRSLRARLARQQVPADGLRRQERARALRAMLEDLGPIYIKLGQILATRPDIMPQYLMDEFANLNDQARIEPFRVFEPVIEAEMGGHWRSRFQEINTERPLGAASVAQVYRGVWTDGRPCVLKVQRPGTSAAMLGDMAVLRRVAGLLHRAAPHMCEVIDVKSMMDVVFTAMEAEVDFTREARNMKDARKAARHFKQVKVPKVIEATPRVLVQTFVDGTPINRVKDDQLSDKQRKKIAYQLMGFMFRGYFVDRAFHADPHPGNILIDQDGKAYVIDWGMYGKIDRNASLILLKGLVGMARGDGAALARDWIKLGSLTPWSNSTRFANDVSNTIPYWANATLEELNFGVALMSLARYSTERGIQVSPLVSLIGKSMGNIEGSVRSIYPRLKFDKALGMVMQDIARELLADSLGPENGMHMLLDSIYSFNNSSSQMQSVLGDMTTGQLGINVRTNQADPLGPRRGQRLKHHVSLGSTAAAAAAETVVRRTLGG